MHICMYLYICNHIYKLYIYIDLYGNTYIYIYIIYYMYVCIYTNTYTSEHLHLYFYYQKITAIT